MITAGDDDLEADNTEAQERQIERNQRMATAPGSSEEGKARGDDEESDDWEDIDCDDGEIEEIAEVNSD